MTRTKILFILLSLGLISALAGCMGADEATIYCDAFQVDGIFGDIVTPEVVNLDTDADGTNDALLVIAIVTRLDTSEVLYHAPRVTIPVWQSADGIGFTSDAFSFPAVPEGTLLSVRYTSQIDFSGLPSPPFPSGSQEVELLMYEGECVARPATASDEWSPGDGRLNPDRYAYAAVYCDAANQQIVVWGVNSPGAGDRNDGSGFLALTVPYSDVPPASPDGSVLIAQNDRVRLYRNMQGELVAVAGPDAEGKEYVVLWDACPPTYVQRFILQGEHLQRTQ